VPGVIEQLVDLFDELQCRIAQGSMLNKDETAENACAI
jgi:hypothetical protein